MHAVTEEDKTWTEDASDDETQRDRKNAQAIITELNKANEAEQASHWFDHYSTKEAWLVAFVPLFGTSKGIRST